MSGLAALFNRDRRPADGDTVRAMLAAAAYRGPDGLWIRSFGDVALGHAKMAVTPEEIDEIQPLVSARTGCAIVADAQLDNREELLSLIGDSVPPASSDTDLILRAFEKWGDRAAERLLGDYAFVIWDPRENRVVCARDGSGQRTLFYRYDRRTFSAASEIHQLFQDASVPVAPNEAHIREFLVPLNAFRVEKDTASTFYEGIFAVPPGHILTVDQSDVQIRRFWQLEPQAEIRYRKDEDYAAHFRELFADVVRTRLRSAFPIGAMLSGGLDSSSVVCTAQDLYRKSRATNYGFQAYSFSFDGLECDEQEFIDEIDSMYGTRTRFVAHTNSMQWLQADPVGFLESPTSGISQRGELYAAAADDGVRTLLTGMVADACIPGSPLVFDSLLRNGRFRDFLSYLRAYRREAPDRTWRKIAASTIVAPMLPMTLQQKIMSSFIRRDIERAGHLLMPWWMPDALRVDLTQRHLSVCLAEEASRRYSSPAREAEFRLLSPPENNRTPVGWPLQFRHPFADRRLQQFLLSIPPEQKFRPHPTSDEYYASTKWLLRRSMRGILPEPIRTRTNKTFFNGVFDAELRHRWADYASLFGPNATPEIARRGYIDQERFWMRLEAGRDGAELPDTLYVVRMVVLESWFRALAKGRPTSVTVADPRPPAVAAQSRAEAAVA